MALCYNQAVSTAKDLVIERGGKITLPDEVLSRYGLTDDAPLRMIETRNGILLVPMTDGPMSESLISELQEWQGLGAESLALFTFDEDDLP